MATITRFEDLEIWQLARVLSKRIYEITARAIFHRDFKLAAQMRDAVCSSMSNPAEGFERNNNREFYYFVRVAKGSTGELRSQLYNCLDRGFVDEVEFASVKAELEVLSSKQRSFMDYLDRVNKQEALTRRTRGGGR
ncbi:MAG TPA: four helix bundle protein [Flavobacteriales bacterium]|jgi:four helix bundle protein|nr:four helix bundle protein [Flavobacteriales bacterium]